MRTNRDELIILRESLARVALAAGLWEHIPGNTEEHPVYSEIHRLASENDRGWNALCARLVDLVHQTRQSEQREARQLIEDFALLLREQSDG